MHWTELVRGLVEHLGMWITLIENTSHGQTMDVTFWRQFGTRYIQAWDDANTAWELGQSFCEFKQPPQGEAEWRIMVARKVVLIIRNMRNDPEVVQSLVRVP